MQSVVTSAEMRAFDHYTIKRFKIPGLILMENAGRGVVERMEHYFGPLEGKTILIFCGKGNNGGDGFVVARHLYNRGAQVAVALLGKASELKHDSKFNYEILKRIEKNVANKNVLHILELRSSSKFSMLPGTDIIVDALFGTGFSGEISGIFEKTINWINRNPAQRVSVDVPSGMNSDNGEVKNTAVKADLTVTLGLIKAGLILYNGMNYTGKLQAIDIGIPRKILDIKPVRTFIVDPEDIRRIIPKRPLDAHKHNVGKILVLSGARGFTGAVAMVSISAMRAGAGAVVLAVPASVYPILARKVTEVMVEPLTETKEGTISLNAYDVLKKRIAWADILIIGPGLSLNPETQQLVRKIVAEVDKPMLIDADGLNAFAENPSALKNHRSRNLILTPHTGELSRLTGIPSIDIERNRVELARRFAKKFNATLVLKGAPTVTASESGEVFINSTGNPGMATAGSGDILAGLIGGLWAQGMERTEASYAGVFLHGRAGDFAKGKFGEKSMMAMDIQRMLPESFLEIEHGYTS